LERIYEQDGKLRSVVVISMPCLPDAYPAENALGGDHVQAVKARHRWAPA
jgi:hypothetical protein